MTITADHLRPVLLQHEAVVDLALEQLFPDPLRPVNLEGLRVLAQGGKDLAEVLVDVIEDSDNAQSLERFLNARGIKLIARPNAEFWDEGLPPFANTPIGEPPEGDLPMAALGDFALRASAYRCRIMVDGATEGSGAFISKRLVLTAAHVIEKVTNAQKAAEAAGVNDIQLPPISILASDGKAFEARCVWSSPVHDQERTGGFPPLDEVETHKDVAVLRVGLPLGLNYGYCELPDRLVEWTGPRLMTLVHYPDGVRRGLTKGRVQRDTPDDVRLRHDVDTLGGSSGGLAFDRNLDFIGIHQGRWNAFRRLVPHGIFGSDPGFVDARERDQPRRYLWSIEDDINGQLIIGRQTFFAGIARMLEHPQSLLRGIWVRRTNVEETTGLNFSFEMLTAFLKNRIRPSDLNTGHSTYRVATDIEEIDLIATLANQVLGARAVQAHAGVRAGETSDVAQERDRAMHLAQALQAEAVARNETFWLFFETPPDDKLSEAARTQFEHLAEWLVTHPNLRLVLAGFEAFAIEPLKFQHAIDADTARKPGLLVDPLGHFTTQDIQVSLTAMLSDLCQEDNVNPIILQDLMRQATRGLTGPQPGEFHFSDLGKAVKNLRRIVKTRAGLD
ncbi:MAG: serine protease [Sulfitobacter sp.]